MAEEQTIEVEVAYALPHQQFLVKVMVQKGADIFEAIRQSGVLSQYEGIDLDKNKVGIFGKICGPDTVVQAGDRVEIYRPLLADPKQSRQARAQKAKKKKSE